jgi:hypothetical protein
MGGYPFEESKTDFFELFGVARLQAFILEILTDIR